MSSNEDSKVAFYGFTAVPRDPDVLFHNHPTASGENPKQDLVTADDFPFPDSPLVREVQKFAQKELNEGTYRHSNRAYIYGVALTKSHFPKWEYDLETYYIACLLHDIGVAERFLSTTKMSFEFKGGVVARDLILHLGGVEDQADSVCEAIIRHQDLFVKGGNITMIGQVLQLATIIDNAGVRVNLLHPKLIESVVAHFPRSGRQWSETFASTIETELRLKPWCHSTTFEVPGFKMAEGVKSAFAEHVRGNPTDEMFKEWDV